MLVRAIAASALPREGAQYANLMITMLLGGLWHGAVWTFAFWGVLHGAYLVLHRLLLDFYARMGVMAGSLVLSWLGGR